MTWITNQSRQSEQGQVLIMTAVLIPLLFGIAALAFDLSRVYAARQSAQNAADAAAQVAVKALYKGASTSTATADAQTYAHLNGFTNSNSTITVSIPPAGGSYSGQAAQVTIKPNISPLLGPVVGVTQIGSTSTAIAAVGGGAPCGLCVLSPSGSGSLNVQGSAHIIVNNAGVTVNSSDTQAAIVQNSGNVSATGISVVGGSVVNQGGVTTPAITNGASPIPDPFANVPLPSVPSNTYADPNVANGANVTINPGIYPSITLNYGTLTMNPGTYVITGKMVAQNNGTLNASGVTLYFACSGYPTACSSSGQAGGFLDLTGTTYHVTLTPPTNGSYQGIVVFYDRHNTSNLTVENGVSDTVNGSIYAALGTLNLQGGTPTVVGSMVVVYHAIVQNNAYITLNYNAGQNYKTGLPTLVQ